ncbi:unnamed protein product [Cuscuta europaea]|uniref:DUF1985 domain-containing protein n=1 Tax=Cuscuta europaea TaxID=41803 RepID=A0A9P0YHC1_CUSEU|nr:unnamed protein product [Cuscuta europaea]
MYLGGSVDTTFEKFKEILQKLRSSRRGDPTDVVKLASLYFVQCVFLAKDRTTKINPDFVRLVNDFDKFKDYSWYKEAYKLLVTHLNGLMVGQPKKFKECKAKFTIYGSPLVVRVSQMKLCIYLLIWLFIYLCVCEVHLIVLLRQYIFYTHTTYWSQTKNGL